MKIKIKQTEILIDSSATFNIPIPVISETVYCGTGVNRSLFEYTHVNEVKYPDRFQIRIVYTPFLTYIRKYQTLTHNYKLLKVLYQYLHRMKVHVDVSAFNTHAWVYSLYGTVLFEKRSRQTYLYKLPILSRGLTYITRSSIPYLCSKCAYIECVKITKLELSDDRRGTFY